MADREPEGHLSADEGRSFDEWWSEARDRLVHSSKAVRILTADKVAEMFDLLGEGAANLYDQNRALRSTIVDLEAERDAAEFRVDELTRIVGEAAGKIREHEARAAADTPKLQAAQRVASIHQPYTETAEFYCFYDGSDDEWGCPSYDKCAGHELPIEVCSECGHTAEDDRIMYRAWPCPTAEALAAAFTEEPAAPKIAPTPRPAEPSLDVACEGSAECGCNPLPWGEGDHREGCAAAPKEDAMSEHRVSWHPDRIQSAHDRLIAYRDWIDHGGNRVPGSGSVPPPLIGSLDVMAAIDALRACGADDGLAAGEPAAPPEPERPKPVTWGGRNFRALSERAAASEGYLIRGGALPEFTDLETEQ